MVKRLEIFVTADGVRNTEVQRVECREQTNEKMGKRGMRKWIGKEDDTAARAKEKKRGARWIERGDCVLFCGHHSFTHGIRGRGWPVSA